MRFWQRDGEVVEVRSIQKLKSGTRVLYLPATLLKFLWDDPDEVAIRVEGERIILEEAKGEGNDKD